MKNILIVISILIWTIQSFSQENTKLSLSFGVHINSIVYDAVFPHHRGNGPGLDVQLGLANHTIFKPVFELDWDRVQYGPQDMLAISFQGKDVIKKRSINAFIGTDAKLYKGLKIEFIAGPSFLDAYTYLGLKSAIMYCFGKNEKFCGKVSFTYIRTIYGEAYYAFEYMSFIVGFKIF